MVKREHGYYYCFFMLAIQSMLYGMHENDNKKILSRTMSDITNNSSINLGHINTRQIISNSSSPISLLTTNYHQRKIDDFLIAAKQGDCVAIKSYLDEGVNINAQDSFGCTALHLAIAYAQEAPDELVKFLLDRNADISIKTRRGTTVLDYAVQKKYQYITYLLVMQHATGLPKRKMREIKQIDLLLKAISKKDIGAVRKLLKRKVQPITPVKQFLRTKYRELLEAVKANDADRMIELNKEGVSFAVRVDEMGNTLLHKAMQEQSPEVFYLLLRLGLDPTLINNAGETAIHSALKVSIACKNLDLFSRVVEFAYKTPQEMGFRMSKKEILKKILTYLKHST